jgi:hypothetical protein
LSSPTFPGYDNIRVWKERAAANRPYSAPQNLNWPFKIGR